MMRISQLTQRHGVSRSTLYKHFSTGDFPPPVKIGDRACAVPSHESDAIHAARLAGHSQEQIRALVTQLVAQRATEAPTSI